MDSFCVGDVFEKPWMGMVTSALASLIVFAPLPYILPFVEWQWPEWQIIVMAISAGALIQLSQGLYFKALGNSEAGIVASYWSLVPAMVPIASFVVFGEHLSLITYVGITILIVSSIGFCKVDTNLKGRLDSLVYMIGASLMQTAMFLLEEIVFISVPYFVGFLFITAGIVITGSSFLIIPQNRILFKRNMPKLSSIAKLFVVIEVINLTALAFSQRAVDLGIPSLVAGVESTIPAYTFLISAILYVINHKFGDKLALKNIAKKFTLIGVMVIGVILIA